jgi:hypothetical protein
MPTVSVGFVRSLAVLSGLVAGMCCTVAGTAAADVSGTVASWQMNEAAGSKTMVDTSGNGHNGTISSGVTVGSSGFSGLAYGFTGNHATVSVPPNSAFDHGAKPYSVSLEFKSTTLPSASVGDYDLIRKGLTTSSGGDWKMEIWNTGRVFCHFRGTKAVDLKGKTNVVDGAWHQLTCRVSTSSVSVVVDGTVQATSASLPGPIANSSSIIIGARDSTMDSTTGKIDSVVIRKS